MWRLAHKQQHRNALLTYLNSSWTACPLTATVQTHGDWCTKLLLDTMWTKILRTTRLVLWCCPRHPASGSRKVGRYCRLSLSEGMVSSRWLSNVTVQRDCPTWLSNVTVQRDCPTWFNGISSFHVSGYHILQNAWFEMLFILRWLPVFTSLSFFLLFFYNFYI